MGLLWLAEPAAAQQAPAPSLEAQLAGSQALRLELNGTAGRMYRIETSGNLADWAAVLTTNSVTGNLDVMIGVAESVSFYRAVDVGPAPGSNSPSAEFTLLWPAPGGSVVFAVRDMNGKAIASQVVNLSSNTNQATVSFILSNGDYTVVADEYPQPAGMGVPFEEARFSFTINADPPPVTQTFNLAYKEITRIILTPPNLTVAVGGTAQLNASELDASNEVVFVAAPSGALRWSSLDPTVATVDFTGKVTGVAPGPDTIYVTDSTNGSITTNEVILSTNEIAGLTITNSSVVYVGVGATTNLGVLATNASGGKVTVAASALTWSSSAATNAVVDGDGLLVGVALGVADITVSLKFPAYSSAIIANVTLAGSGGGAGVAPPANGYIVTDLGTLTFPQSTISSLPVGINDYGHIAGFSWQSLSPTNDTTAPEAFIWKTSLNNVMTNLPDLGGGQAEVSGINNSDEVAGWSIKSNTISSTKQYSHAVLWRSGKAIDLNKELPTPTSPPWPPLEPPNDYNAPNISDAFRVNNEDEVIGTASFFSTNAVNWASALLLELEDTNVTYLWASLDFLTQPAPSPEAINDVGEMAGGQFVFNGISASYAYAFVGQLGQLTSDQVAPLGNLAGYQSGLALSINNLSQAAGVCSQAASAVPEFIQPRAVAWQDGAANLEASGPATDLGSNGYYSRAWCINDLGTVVGDSWPGTGGEYTQGRAILWQSTNAYDLNAYIPTNSGWVLVAATGINNKGQIVGQGTCSNELGYRAFLLTPNN